MIDNKYYLMNTFWPGTLHVMSVFIQQLHPWVEENYEPWLVIL